MLAGLSGEAGPSVLHRADRSLVQETPDDRNSLLLIIETAPLPSGSVPETHARMRGGDDPIRSACICTRVDRV